MIRSRAPLRIGLAGGGTDVSPYSDDFGGAILNACIDKYAYAFLEPWDKDTIEVHSLELEQSHKFSLSEDMDNTKEPLLFVGVYQYLKRTYPQQIKQGFKLTTSVDVPLGSGLGTSSTLAVAILGAFVEWFKLPLGDYEIARLAYDIERHDLKMAGGKQDQYAATFGGVNFMEFHKDRVIVNPLRIPNITLYELELNLVLYYSSISRFSSKIIQDQVNNMEKKDSINSLNHLKEQSYQMKEAILTKNLSQLGQILEDGWQSKKKTAKSVSNEVLDKIYHTAMSSGATGGKVSGAGGGGFMIFYCPGTSRYPVIKALEELGGKCYSFHFVSSGLETWSFDEKRS